MWDKILRGVRNMTTSAPRPANRSRIAGGMGPGATNFKEALTPNRWGGYDDALTATRADFFYGDPIHLPTHAQFSGAFANGMDATIGVTNFDPYGAASRPKTDLAPPGRETYYGFLAYGVESNASRTTVPLGYRRPLNSAQVLYMYQGSAPVTLQPQVNEPPPWEADYGL